MLDVTCDIRTLTQSRPSDLAKCLSGVSRLWPYIHPRTLQYEYQFVASSHGGRSNAPVREWDFPSTVETIQCRYMERWLPTEASDEIWTLRNTYLHLFWHMRLEEKPREIFAFHWKPSVVVSEEKCTKDFHIFTSRLLLSLSLGHTLLLHLR